MATPADHILTILAVKDLAASTAFYEAAFGWPRHVDVGVYVEFELPGGRGLGVYRREAFAGNTGERPAATPSGATTATELYFRVADLDASTRRLEAAGARLLSARAERDWGDEAAYYADPDGNVLVVAIKSVDGGDPESGSAG